MRDRRLDSWGSALPGVVVVALAAVLRIVALGAVKPNPFYDAAVRSMGLSWHNFLFGAFEPGGSLAIDKPPVDLWLQVGFVHLFGFNTWSLLLPEALGGTLAVAALYALVNRLYGRGPALASALALAVLPIAVLTSRSDTMDSVMGACLVGSALLVVRAAQSGRRLMLLGAGALLGLAFEVKLLESLVAVPALAMLYLLASETSLRRRMTDLALTTGAFVMIALSWVTVASSVPGHHPYPLGSTNGSVWNSMFVYDGTDRVFGPPTHVRPRPTDALGIPSPRLVKARAIASARERRYRALSIKLRPAPRGLTRLFSPDAQLDVQIGIELLAALLFGGAALSARRPVSRLSRAAALAFGLWAATGAFVFTAMSRLEPRYLEAFSPAVAACLGVSVAVVTRSAVRSWAALASTGLALATALIFALTRQAVPAALEFAAIGCAATGVLILAGGRLSRADRGRAASAGAMLALVAVLSVPAWASVNIVHHRDSDSGRPGALPAKEVTALSDYLRAHDPPGSRYEVASVAAAKAGPLVVRDDRPVLILTVLYGRVLTPTSTLANDVARGDVRYALEGTSCTPTSKDLLTGCSAPAQWVRHHGVDVSIAAGLNHRGLLYRLRSTIVPRRKRHDAFLRRATKVRSARRGRQAKRRQELPRAHR